MSWCIQDRAKLLASGEGRKLHKAKKTLYTVIVFKNSKLLIDVNCDIFLFIVKFDEWWKMYFYEFGHVFEIISKYITIGLLVYVAQVSDVNRGPIVKFTTLCLSTYNI